MKLFNFSLLVLTTLLTLNSQAQSLLDANYFNSLKYKHDLNLPDWGPYTKKYIGVSHIPDVDQGIRFDLSVFPGFYRRKVDVPNVFFESGFHPWEASPNLEYFSFRHELEWKDRVYTDVSYSLIDDKSRLVRVECVNNTDVAQSIVLHLMASIHFPSIKEYNPNTPLEFSTVKLPEYAVWVDGLDYQDLKFATPRPQDQLGYDGKLRGEIRDHGLINGSGIGDGFGKDLNDRVAYQVQLKSEIKDAVIWLRYKLGEGQSATLRLEGMSNSTLKLVGNGDFKVEKISLGAVKAGSHSFSISSNGNSAIKIDGFAVVNNKDVEGIKVKAVEWNYTPQMLDGPEENSVILKYENTGNYYGLYWDYDDYQLRQWHYKDLSDDFKQNVNGHVSTEFSNGTNGHFTNVFLRPITIASNSSLTVNGVVCTGTKTEVEGILKNKISRNEATKIYEKAREYLYSYNATPSGEKYMFSNQRMAATTITNVVYPVYTQRQYIRHHAPGRWWDCLYTWDAGFIGIGLAQQDVQRGIESLNAYLNEPDEQSAFIHHGTPLPVQHYLFQELWNATQSEEFLQHYYPKLRQYYEFIAGKNPSSTTRMDSNLIRTWDYFYNSGGWDDYPPQHHLRKHRELYENVTPVVSTAHCIRIAKILQMAASHLKLKKDVREYETDIARMANALQAHSWDEQSGYYGYVVHDKTGQAEDILKFEDKTNYNMGLGGVSPLLAGISTDQQKEKMLKHLKTKGEIWSDVGLSAVDQTAPYYSNEGYWNGTVWMPHQWFMWKTMLDLGEADFAFKIADTALNLWKKEVESTYNCSEHFVIESGRGAGWHQFSGLSTPVLSWFNAYYQQSTLTTGFNAWVLEKKFDSSNTSLSAKLKVSGDKGDEMAMVVCLNPEYAYQVSWNNQPVPHKEISKGTLSIVVPNIKEVGVLKVERVVR
ncbi:MAG: trehalase family glycosidase [Cyclobacteriaceae bacterium]